MARKKSCDDSIHSLHDSSTNKGLITELNVFNMQLLQHRVKDTKVNVDAVLDYYKSEQCYHIITHCTLKN